nr:thiamine phosphate synthase [Sulfurimonas sp. MAG313]
MTDPSIIGSTPASILSTLPLVIEKYTPHYICLRDKNNPLYTELAEAFMSIQGDHKTLLHGNVDLAVSLGAYGVHLTSLQYDEIKKAKDLGLYVIASTHCIQEAQEAELADAISYSPIFATANKGKPKGLADLKEIMGKININIFALGGITTSKQIEQVQSTGVYGFASIRHFKI